MHRVTMREMSQNGQSALNGIRQDQLDCNVPRCWDHVLGWKGPLRLIGWARMMTTKTRCKIDTALKAKIALEAVREQATMADLAQR